MKFKTYIFAMVTGLLGVLPGTVSAQPGSQPFVYGEEPWGGSYLGVDTRDVTPDQLSALHLKDESGVEITMVDQDAPAGKAGLKEHDVILSVNDHPVESVEQLRRMIREIPAGRTVALGISRDGQPMTVKAQLAQRDKMPGMEHGFNFNMPAINIPPINLPPMDLAGPVVVMHSINRSGLMVESLTPQLGDYFGVKNGNGVLVRSVEKGSKAEQAGFRAGDVVVKVNGSVVNDCSDFTRLLRGRKESKVSVTVLRERKEQNLTIVLPEPKRSGAMDAISDERLELESRARQIAALVPEVTTAELKRIQPEIERAKKQIQQELLNHRDEFKKDVEKMHEELQQQKQELEREMKSCMRDTEI